MELLVSLESENQQGPMRCSNPQLRKGKPREGQDLPKVTQQWGSRNRASSGLLPPSATAGMSSMPQPLPSTHPGLQSRPFPGKLRVYSVLYPAPPSRYSPPFSLRSSCVCCLVRKICDSVLGFSSASSGGHSRTLSP